MRDTFNELGQTVCGKCAHVIVTGEWPFCPHPMRSGVVQIERDEIPGGLTVENYGPNPITFYSHSERRAYMHAHGLHETERFSPFPGTDKDPQGIPNPKGYMDLQTMENARVLLSRGDQRGSDETRGVLIGLSTGHMTERDVEAVTGGNLRRLSRLGRRTDGR